MQNLFHFQRAHRRIKGIDKSQFEILDTNNPLILECKANDWTCSREFDFSPLYRIYKQDIAIKVANAVSLYLVRFARATAINRFQEFNKYMYFLNSLITIDFNRISKKAELRKSDFLIRSISRYQEEIRNRSTALTTQAENLNSIYLILEELSSLGLGVPVNRVSMPKNYHHSQKKKKSLLEKNEVNDISDSTLNLRDELEKNGYLITEETLPFILSLETSVNDSKHAHAVDFFQSLIDENNARLDALREAAETTFISWRNVYEDGQIHLSNADSDVVNKFSTFLSQTKKDFDLFWSIFPKTNYEQALANFLYICKCLFDSKVPSSDDHPDLRSSLTRLITWLGGKYYVDAMLAPHKEMVVSVILLYMIDTGANVSTALNMDIDFESELDDSKYAMIKSSKPRANYKTISSVLPIKQKGVKVTTVEALRFIRDATSERRKLLKKESNKLFIFTFFSIPSVADGDFVANNTHYLLKRFGLPSSWTPDAIRMSVAIKTMWSESGRLASVARKLGQATDSPVTNGYAFSYPVKGLLENYIRQFQDLFQFAISLNLDGVAVKLGCLESELPNLKKKIMNSGLGFLWVKPDSEKTNNQIPIRADMNLKLVNTDSRILIFADEENLPMIIATNKILTELQGELEAQSASHWEQKWAPLLALSQVVIEKIKRSEFAFKLEKSKVIANELIKKGFNPLNVSEL